MIDVVLLHVGGGLTALWGIAHLFPTKSVVAGFGEISADNRRIITMEWIVEGVALVFMGALVCTVTVVDGSSAAAGAVYILTVLGLLALAIVSLFTGFGVSFLPFKLCPFIFGLSAALVLIGGVL